MKTYRTFLFVYSATMGNEETIESYIDSRREIVNWMRHLPHAYLLVSAYSVSELHALLMALKGLGKGTFVVAEIHPHAIRGWMARKFWDCIRNPGPAG